MFKWFLPREERFQTLFAEDAVNLREAAALFADLARATDLEARRAKAVELKDLEHRGDDITRQIFEALNTTFLTPFDREDIRELASGIDDALDEIEAVGKDLVQFKLTDAPQDLVQMAEIMSSGCREVEVACSLLWDPTKAREVHRRIIVVSDLENQADAIFNLVMTRLFDPSNGKDAVQIMKWKEIYQGIEDGIDQCRHVANVLGDIVTKNA